MRIDALAPLTKVKVIGLDCPGRIEWVKIDYGNTVLYQVCYWHCGEQKFAMLHRDEVELSEEK